MKKKKSHKKPAPGLTAQLMIKTPRLYTGDLNDKKALAEFRRGEVIHNSAEKIETELSVNLKELNERVKTRKEFTVAASERFHRNMPVEDKIVRKIIKTFTRAKNFIRRKI